MTDLQWCYILTGSRYDRPSVVSYLTSSRYDRPTMVLYSHQQHIWQAYNGAIFSPAADMTGLIWCTLDHIRPNSMPFVNRNAMYMWVHTSWILFVRVYVVHSLYNCIRWPLTARSIHIVYFLYAAQTSILHSIMTGSMPISTLYLM